MAQAEADSMDLGSYTEGEQVQASLQVGANARQLIVEGVIQLQVASCRIVTCYVLFQLAFRSLLLGQNCSCESIRDQACQV